MAELVKVKFSQAVTRTNKLAQVFARIRIEHLNTIIAAFKGVERRHPVKRQRREFVVADKQYLHRVLLSYAEVAYSVVACIHAGQFLEAAYVKRCEFIIINVKALEFRHINTEILY